MNRPPRQHLYLRLQTLMSNSLEGRYQRRQFLEVLTIVGTISLVFGGVAWLLSVLAHDSSSSLEHHRQRIAEQGPRPASTAAEEEPQVEVYLGEFSSTQSNSQSAAKHPDGEGVRVVEFEVSAIMPGTYESSVRLRQHLKKFEHRVRETMNIVARGASDLELADPATKSLREKIRTRLNHMLGKPQFDEVVFTSFQVYEF